MGCICSKETKANQYVEQNANEKELESNKSSKQLADPCKGGGNDTSWLIPNHVAASESTPVSSDEGENVVKNEKVTNTQLQRRGTVDVATGGTRVQQPVMSRIVSISSGAKGAQVAAGWPSWLAAVAGEAINGWVPRKADSFERMDKIGQGTYSSVYRARDLESDKLVALKKVRFVNMDPESVRFMAREIIILRRLDHPNVMKLEGLITSRVSGSLYLVFEYMEHDLSGLVATPGIKFTEAQIKCYMQQLLWGLEHCHNHGILHRDIKGSNLLIDNNSNLKIGDFGLATFFSTHQKQPLTSRVVTLWYRPPELLLGATDYGVAVDLWSTGCILAELFAGKPIMPGRTEVEQLHKIFKLCGSPSEEYWKRSKLPHATIFKPQLPYKRRVTETFKDFPSSALGLLDILLAVEPENRGTATSVLESEFFKTDPLPCDPSSLPKYPPSKEFDAKLRDEEARRRRAFGTKGRVHDPTKRVPRESKAMPAPDANAELQESIQKRKMQANSVSVSEKYHSEDCDSGFPMDPSRGSASKGFSYSRSMQAGASNSSRNEDVGHSQTFRSTQNHMELRQQSGTHHGTDQLSRFSNSVAVRGASKYDSINGHWPEEHYNPRPESSNRNGPSAEREISTGYASENRIHYSGPLLPSKGNLDQILKEHEKRIRNAVRKARVDKTKTKTKNKKTYGGNGQTESLLLHVGNER